MVEGFEALIGLIYGVLVKDESSHHLGDDASSVGSIEKLSGFLWGVVYRSLAALSSVYDGFSDSVRDGLERLQVGDYFRKLEDYSEFFLGGSVGKMLELVAVCTIDG